MNERQLCISSLPGVLEDSAQVNLVWMVAVQVKLDMMFCAGGSFYFSGSGVHKLDLALPRFASANREENSLDRKKIPYSIGYHGW
jgi:hypothetical protein